MLLWHPSTTDGGVMVDSLTVLVARIVPVDKDRRCFCLKCANRERLNLAAGCAETCSPYALRGRCKREIPR